VNTVASGHAVSFENSKTNKFLCAALEKS